MKPRKDLIIVGLVPLALPGGFDGVEPASANNN